VLIIRSLRSLIGGDLTDDWRIVRLRSRQAGCRRCRSDAHICRADILALRCLRTCTSSWRQVRPSRSSSPSTRMRW